MYGSNRDSGISPLNSYAEALTKYNGTKPIRGRTGDQRPLGHRRRPHFQIALDAETNNVICRCYNSPVVTFEPSGDVILNVPKDWQTGTTANFIGDVLGWYNVNTAVYDHSVVLYIRRTGAKYRVGTEMRLRYENGCYNVVSNDKKSVQHSVNRKAMSDARKSVEAFSKYIIGSIRLRDGSFNEEEAVDMFETLKARGIVRPEADLKNNGWTAKLDWAVVPPTYSWWVTGNEEKLHEWLVRLDKFMEMVKSSNTEDLYLASIWFAHSLGGWSVRSIKVSEHDFRRHMDELHFIYDSNTLLETEEEEGTVKRNKFAKFIPFIRAQQTRRGAKNDI